MIPLYRTKVFRRQVIAISSLALFFFGAAGSMLLFRTRQTILESQAAITELACLQVSEHFRSWLDERRSDVSFLAAELELDSPSSYGGNRVTQTLARFCYEKPTFVEAIVVDSSSNLINARQGAARKVDLSDRDYIQEALRGRKYVSKLFPAKQAGTPVFAISAPIRVDSVSRFAIAGVVTLRDLVKMAEAVDLGSFGKAFLVDGEGRLVMSPEFEAEFRKGFPNSLDSRLSTLAARSLALGKTGSARYVSAEGVDVFGSWAPIEALGLGLVVELSVTEALEPLNRLLVFAAVLAFATLVLIGLASWVLSSRLIKPIGALIEAVDELSVDRFRGPIDIRTGTELDTLIESFNSMVDTVRRRENDLRDNAARDSLTGLFNHGRIEEYLELELRKRRRNDEPIAFVMLDIDHFKAVNDRFGHLAGDEVLRALSRLLLENVREGDIVGRYGGEEFAIVVASKNPVEVEALCERIRKRVEDLEIDAGGTIIKVTLSIGWCCLAPERNVPFDVIRKADRALYDAKNAGRNKTLGYSISK